MMPIQSVNASTSYEQSTYATDVESFNILSQTVELAQNLFTTGKEEISKHYVMTLATVGAFIGGYFWAFHFKHIHTPSSKNFIEKIKPLIENRDDALIHLRIEQFINQTFASRQFKQRVRNAGTNNYLKAFLIIRLDAIILSQTSYTAKAEMIENTLDHLSNLISTAHQRVNADVKKGTLNYLHIEATDSVLEIRPLGDETHHGGKIPLHLIFKSGQEVVYKPRLMLPEYLLCDEQDSICKEAGFGTYKVICNSDQFGDYGYTDFLQNKQEENTVNSIEEVSNYLYKLCLLEKISQGLGLSDLHYLNIITDGLEPRVIDAEVFLNPAHISPRIFDPAFGAAHKFDYSQGEHKHLVGKNRIWISPGLLQDKECNFTYGMSAFDLKKLGIDLNQLRNSTHLPLNVRGKIDKACTLLGTKLGRFVLRETQHLKSMQQHLDHTNPATFDVFVEDIKECVNKEPCFTFENSSVPAIRDSIKKDSRNFDIPAFYYDSQKHTLLYDGIVIGVPKQSTDFHNTQ